MRERVNGSGTDLYHHQIYGARPGKNKDCVTDYSLPIPSNAYFSKQCYPFPTYNKSAADDFEYDTAKTSEIYINERIITDNG